MSGPTPAPEDYRHLDRTVESLVGRRLTSVVYWDVNSLGHPRVWDHGDWHHAVMGIDFRSDRGPFSVNWASTFWQYGAEMHEAPLYERADLGPEGPESWDVTKHPVWRERCAGPIEGAEVVWTQWLDGVGGSHDAPVAIRLDFAAGPVWLVAAQPMDTGTDDFALCSDEIIAVFTRDFMQRRGMLPPLT